MSYGLKREYLSPNYKLLPFFEKSRDQWKEKAQRAQRQVNKLKERLRQVRGRRDQWKEAALVAQAALAEAKRSAGSAC
jgi:hypothetical protein